MRIAVTSIFLLAFLSCKKDKKPISDAKLTDSAQISTSKTDTVTSGQPKQEVFQFVTELCENKGYFNSNIYSREEIEGTYKLWYELSGSLLDIPSAYSLKSLAELRNNKDKILAKLDKDFAARKTQILNLKVVNTPYWQGIKKKTYEELVQTYEKYKIQVAAYSDPSVLLKNDQCKNFSKALNSTDDQMFAEWKKLREEASKNNGNPQHIMDEFNEQLNSSDNREYAIIDLITFGWGNCANSKIQRVSHDEAINNQFEALFIKIDSECDEP